MARADKRNGASGGDHPQRFGSLIRAYRLVGYNPGRDCSYIEINRALRIFHASAVAEAVAAMQRVGATIRQDPETDLLTVNQEFTVSVVVARSLRTGTGALRWKIRLDAGLVPDITVAIRMDESNAQASNYYVLPRIDVGAVAKVRLSEENGVFLDAYRFDTLDDFFWLTRRTSIVRAA